MRVLKDFTSVSQQFEFSLHGRDNEDSSSGCILYSKIDFKSPMHTCDFFLSFNEWRLDVCQIWFPMKSCYDNQFK